MNNNERDLNLIVVRINDTIDILSFFLLYPYHFISLELVRSVFN